MTPWSGLRGLPAGMWTLAAAVLVNRAGTMFVPFLVLYLTGRLHYSAERAGMLMALYGLGGLLASPVAGRLADRYGAARVMRASLFLSGGLLFLFPLARGGAAVVALVLLVAVAAEIFRPASLAVVTELVPPGRRKQAFALNRLAVNLGMSMGPALGGILAGLSFHLLFVANGVASLLAGLVVSAGFRRLSPGASAADDSAAPSYPATPGTAASAFPARAFGDARLLQALIITLLAGAVFFQHTSTMALYLSRELHFSEAAFGLLFTINTLLIVAFEVPLNGATARWPARAALALGCALVALGFGSLGLARGYWGVAATVAVWTFGEMILLPGVTAYIADLAPAARRGTYMGLFTMAFNCAFALGPWLGTVILQRQGSGFLWAAALAVGLAAAALAARLPEPQALPAPPSGKS